ncbi:LacI family DNA-binding transcriptional regulator [Atopobiaceae bacterium 24-176]
MATIQQVAARAGVSTGTVSRYLNGAKIKESNRERIEEAVAALGYHKNLLAGSLRSRKSRSVGLLVNNMLNHFATSAIAAIEREMELGNYIMLLAGFRNDPEVFEQKLELLLDRQVDGIILFEGDAAWSPGQLVERSGLPVVSVSAPYESPCVDSVLADSRSSAKRVAAEMIRAGHKRLGVIAGPQHEHVSKERLDGVRAAVAEAGLPLENLTVYLGDYSRESGYAGLVDLVEGHGLDTVFCCNYGMGQGALQAVAERGLVIGEDLNYASYDYFDLASLFYPRITTICPPTGVIGTFAASRLLELIDAGTTASGAVTTFPDLITWQPSFTGIDPVLLGRSEEA